MNYSFTYANQSVSGLLNGSFEYAGGVDGGDITVVNAITANHAPYALDNSGNGQASNIGEARYFGGKVLAKSGTTQTLVLWGNLNPSATSCTGGSQGSLCDYGVTLTFNNALVDVPGGNIINFASTGNDNFCNRVDRASISNFCTSQKNNITSLSGTLQSPSPALGLGLVPLAQLVWRRRRRQRLQEKPNSLQVLNNCP